MAVPTAVLADVLAICEKLVGEINPVRWDTALFTNCARAVDREIVALIALTKGHPLQQSLYADSPNISHKGTLPDSLAGWANVRVDTEQATESTTHEIQRLRSGDTVQPDEITFPLYAIRGKKIYFVGGTNAVVGFVPVDLPDNGSGLASPKAYTYAILIGTLRLSGVKDWSEASFSSDLAQEYKSRLQMIAEDASKGTVSDIPPLGEMGV